MLPEIDRLSLRVVPLPLVPGPHQGVLEDRELVGIVTEDAIIQYVFGKPELMNANVSEAMESAFIKLDKDTSVNNLVAMLHVQPYAAIMDGDEFLGLITRSDVLNYLRRQI